MNVGLVSLYAVQAVLILGDGGERVYAKYYKPPHNGEELQEAVHAAGLAGGSVKLQKEFEKRLSKKTRKQDSEILLFEDHLVLYKEYMDVTLYLVSASDENEIVLQQEFSALRDSLDLILDSGIDKKNIQEHYDMVLLAIDEIFDNGIILETDPATIASRVTKPVSGDQQMSLDLDKGLLGAWGFAKTKLQERLQQGL